MMGIRTLLDGSKRSYEVVFGEEHKEDCFWVKAQSQSVEGDSSYTRWCLFMDDFLFNNQSTFDRKYKFEFSFSYSGIIPKVSFDVIAAQL